MLKLNLLFSIIVVLLSSAKAQDPQWLNYTSSNRVASSNFEEKDWWIGTDGGVIKIDTITGVKTFYNVSNSGLPAHSIQKVAIDKYGRKWFGGDASGVTCFDGVSWVNYNYENSALPTPTNFISALTTDTMGFVWIGTDYGGIAKFNGIDWTIFNTSNSGLPNNFVTSIIIDSNGVVWAGTASGLSKFDGINWTVYTTSNSGLPNNYISSLAVSGGDILWIGTPSGLVKFDETNWLTYTTSNSGLPSNNIYPIFIAANDIVWIGSPNGVTKFDGSNWVTYNNSNSGMLRNQVCSIIGDSSGTVWIGTNPDGLVSFNGTTWTVCDISNSGLLGNTITSTAIDNNGMKWMGTFHSSLTSYSGSIWETYSSSNSNIESDDIRAIAIDQTNNAWFATSAGLAKFDGTDFTTYNILNSNLPHNDVLCVAIDGTGIKWIGTHNGLATFDDVSWTVYNSFNSAIPCSTVSSLAIEENGTACLGLFNYGSGCGLTKFDGTNWVTYNAGNSGLPSNDIASIAIDATNTKWIGTYSNGLVKYDGSTWTIFNTANSGLPDNIVQTMVFDQQGVMWIGTNNGLAKFDGTNWIAFNTSNSGLPANSINSISIDDDGLLWIGTSGGGLAVFDQNITSGANFSYAYGCINTPVQFTDLSQLNGGQINSWSWKFGDPTSGSSDTSTFQNPIHLYNTPGTYDVKLLIANNAGYMDTVSHNVSYYPGLEANFNFTNGCNHTPVQFSDISQTNGGGSVNSWSWDFGDTASSVSNSSSLQFPTHLFSSVGTFSVTMICTTSSGCSDTAVKVVVVYEPPLVNAGDNQMIESGSSTQLFATASNGSGNYTWNWEPTEKLEDAYVQNPMTTILTSSVVYTLFVIDQTSVCVAEDQVTVTVTGGPLSVILGANPNPICLGNILQLNSIVSGGTGNYSYSWTSYPSGFVSNLPNPTDNPLQNNQYILEVSDELNSTVDSIQVQVGNCPGQAIIPSGPDVVDLAYVTHSEYTTDGTFDASSYEWQLTPADAGEISGTGLTAILTWNRGNMVEVHITVRGVNEYGQGDWSSEKITTVYNTVGLTQFEKDKIEIFPNPTNGKLKIKSPEYLNKIEILDKLGKIIYVPKKNGTDEYDFGFLDNGAYFVRLYTIKNEIIARMLIINH